MSRWVAPLFVGLTAKIEAREAGDERGLVSSAVFKTVCGALLRRPGWVRFPSIPARFGRRDSQHDSHSCEPARMGANKHGRLGRGIKSLRTVRLVATHGESNEVCSIR